jgi:PPOX class probable FMN-dependent enzyme
MSSSLRECYPQPSERAVLKTQSALDGHMKRFVELSPFVCLGSSSGDGADVTPRGDQPGFVHVFDDATLLIPDWPGNNRLDTLMNIEANPQVGLLFLIPGFNESLRVNGTAEVSLDPALIERWNVNGKHPRSVLRITVREAFSIAAGDHRSKLWDEGSRSIGARCRPTARLKDQIDVRDSARRSGVGRGCPKTRLCG